MNSFILFLIIMSFTPGPNTIMAMLSGQNRGFKKKFTIKFRNGSWLFNHWNYNNAVC